MRVLDRKILIGILTGALAFGTMGSLSVNLSAAGQEESAALGFQPIPENDQAVVIQDTSEMSVVLLPSVGVSYALSTQKVSLQDVEDNMIAQGVITERRSSGTQTPSDGQYVVTTASVTSAFIGTETVNEEADHAEESAEEGEIAEEESENSADSAYLATILTPVQEKEHSLVREATALAGDLDEATATHVASSAVTVVVGGNESAANTAGNELKIAALSGKLTAKTQNAVASKASSDEKEDAVTEDAVEEKEDVTAEEEEAAETSVDASTNSASQSQNTATSGKQLAFSMVSDFLNVRASASTDAEIVGKLYANSVAEIIDGPDADGWLKIESGDVVGYIKQEYVATGNRAQELADSVSKTKAVITTETLRVRAADTVESDVISLIGQGQELDIIEELDGWYKVNTEDGEGYISADFADIEVIYPEAISKQQEEAEEAARRAAEEAKVVQTSISKGQEVVNYAMQFLGNPYVWGGSSLTNGADCSGFTMAVYAHFGVSLPHYDASQRTVGTAVSSLSEARPGDLVCYYGHVGIYIGGGQIIHASNPREGIKIGSASYRQIAAIRRIFN